MKHFLKLKKVIIFFTALLGLALFCKFGLFLLKTSYIGRTYPNTFFINQDIGGQKIEIVEKEIVAKIVNYLESPFAMPFKNKEMQFSPAALGVRMPTSPIMEQVGFVTEKTSDTEFIKNFFSEHKIFPQVSVNEKILTETLKTAFPSSFRESKNARFVSNKGKISVENEENGLKIPVENLSKNLKSAANHLTFPNAVIEEEIVPAKITAKDLEPLKPKYLQILGKKLTLKKDFKKIDLIINRHPEWITFNPEEKVLVVNQDNFLKWFSENLRSFFEVEKQDVKISMDEKGNISFEGFARTGEKIDDTAFLVILNQTINSEKNIVVLPIIYEKSEVNATENLHKKGIKELIGVGYTDFSGSTNERIHNIKVGLKRFNGLIIEPDQEFSFIKNLGEVDGKNGYKEELIIRQDETIKEFGGGLCQVSSTIFRSALLTGLPITERSPHSFAVSYYARPGGQGLDATIYPGSRDLKFLNDTEGSILFQSSVEGNSVYFNIYGTDDGRKVTLENYQTWGYKDPPGKKIVVTSALKTGEKKVKERAVRGFSASWDRIISKGDEVKKETIKSTYGAWGEVILVGGEEKSTF